MNLSETSSFLNVAEPKNNEELRFMVKKLALDLRAFMAFEAASKPQYEKYEKEIEELAQKEKKLKSEIQLINQQSHLESSKIFSKNSEEEILQYHKRLQEKEAELTNLLGRRQELLKELESPP